MASKTTPGQVPGCTSFGDERTGWSEVVREPETNVIGIRPIRFYNAPKPNQATNMAFKLRRRKNFPAISAIVVLAVFVVCYLFIRSHPELLLTGGVGVVAGFVYFLYRQHLDETTLFKEMFVDFNARYDKLNNDLNKILDGPKGGLLSVMERDTVFKYFNLCAEEYLFHEAGYIDNEVWRAWEKGQTIFFSHPRIAALWESEKKTDSYYGFHPPTISRMMKKPCNLKISKIGR